MSAGRYFATFAAAAEVGRWHEKPMFEAGVDPQICLSRNDRAQPFHLICEKDTVLVQMSGTGRVEYALGPVRYHRLRAGDFVYVPAGTPHRLVPQTESVHLRFKAADAGLEGVAWYCERCGAEVHREEWDTAEESPQAGYLRACEAFDADPGQRTCGACGWEHPRLDLSGNPWATLAGSSP